MTLVSAGSRLVATQLMKAYHGRRVVRDVSIEVASGQVVGLLGPNGAGKTTCFYMIVGLVPCDGGSITLDDRPIGRLPIHRRARLGLAYLPQEASVFRKLTVEENITAVLELQQDASGAPLDKAEIKRRLDRLIEELQIGHIRSNTALSLSGGERRRVEIARALANEPSVILADEPTGNLDTASSAQVLSILHELVDRERKAIVIVTHDLGIAERSGRHVTLVDGKLASDEATGFDRAAHAAGVAS